MDKRVSKMNDAETIIYDLVKNMDKKMDDHILASSGDHELLKAHLEDHKQNPDRVSAFAAVSSCIIAIIVLIISMSSCESNTDNEPIEKKIEYIIPKE